MEATRLSGVNVQAVKLWIFSIMGVMCALAGLVNTARLAAGSPSAGSMGEFDAIGTCFIVGISMRHARGSGTVYGALLGALAISGLDNGTSMLDVDSYWQGDQSWSSRTVALVKLSMLSIRRSSQLAASFGSPAAIAAATPACSRAISGRSAVCL